MKKKYLALVIIPARGGSKGVANKNLRRVGGVSLVERKVRMACSLPEEFLIFLSTDSPDIARIADGYDRVLCPSLRPAEISADDTSTLAVVNFVYETLAAEDFIFDYVLVLQPTCPFTTVDQVLSSIDILESKGADGVVSLVNVGGSHPARMKSIGSDGLLVDYLSGTRKFNMEPRQNLPNVYIRSGDIYLFRSKCLENLDTLIPPKAAGLVIDESRCVNIDSEIDLAIADAMANKLLI